MQKVIYPGRLSIEEDEELHGPDPLHLGQLGLYHY